MISIYLNSVYNFFYRHNPFILLLQDVITTIRSFLNLRRNMRRAEQRLHKLEYRLQTVEAYINTTPKQQNPHRFDVTR